MFIKNASQRSSAAEPAQNIGNTRIADLGLSRWETSWSRPSLSNEYFETFLARPRGIATHFSFIVKALRPQYCGSTFGLALIDRERAIGSIDSANIQPLVEHVYPKQVSPSKASRGYLVYPCFKGHTLAGILGKRSLNRSSWEFVRSSLYQASEALSEHGWGLVKLDPHRVFISFNNGSPVSVMLIDHANAYRYLEPGLFTETFQRGEIDVSFDPRHLLPPETFYRSDLHSDSARLAVEELLKQTERV